MDQVARVDTCISLVADDEGEWTNRMQGGRNAQTYLEKDAGGEEMPKHIWRESLKGRSQEWFENIVLLRVLPEHRFWALFWELSWVLGGYYFEDILFSLQVCQNKMWGDFVVLGHRPIWSAWQQREVSICLDDIIFNVYLIRCMKLCVLQIHTLLLVSSCCFIQFMVWVSVYVSVLW